MKNFEIKKEIWLWLIILLPLVYLYSVWNTLPETVPTHFGMDGQPNGWSDKSTLIFIIAGLGVGTYILFTIIPAIDPKGKIESMGGKYFLFKLFMVLFMSALSFIIIHSAVTKTIGNGNLVFVIIGALFAFLGNYMQTIKPNYFLGIRTPWTLESENVWRKTHKLGGKLYFIAGLSAMILPFIMKEHFQQVFLGIILTASLIPIVYSFIAFKQEQKSAV